MTVQGFLEEGGSLPQIQALHNSQDNVFELFVKDMEGLLDLDFLELVYAQL